MKSLHAPDAEIFNPDALAVFGAPRGDELPQVAGEEDILIDIYSDMLNMPREYAAGHFHHQYVEDFEQTESLLN